MLISFIERFHRPGSREMDRCTRWRNTLDRWRSASAPFPPDPVAAAAAMLEGLPEEHQAGALQDMISWSLWNSWEHGPGLTLNSLRAGFEAHPIARGWADAPPLDLVEDEFLARHQQPHGDAPGAQAWLQRFEERADVRSALEARMAGGGRYIRLSMLGGGAMGEVWEAWDCRSRRLVALKQPARDSEISTTERDSLAREFAMAARLRHEGIIQMLDYHEDPVPFFTMSLLRGETFAARVRAFHQPPPDSTREERGAKWAELTVCFARICDAVAAAHEQGVIHRDLKPANVLLGAHGELAVSDWALAKNLRQDDQTAASPHHIVGTPEYMAPEQLDGMADERSDIFGLGAILYEMLTGSPPREAALGCEPSDWRQQLRSKPLPPPSRLPSQASKRLAAICMKALSTEPQDRHATAAELAADVRRHAASQRNWLERIFRPMPAH